ncbi:uncharacterized protein [Haliotis asinina]|uniref:uncharacterized protein isoform X2 n=1 Tax=Haliotis asinina TaxID=109174 RepID=UPI003531C090
MLQPLLEDDLSQSSETESFSSPKPAEEIDFKPFPGNEAVDDDRNTSATSIHSAAIEVESLSSQCQNRMGVAPSLSEGKKYHVFFSYDITDREWVEQITNKLESPDFGFKCSLHERDFHGGKRIIENITEHIRLSEKTVLVLSPNFLQSHWCMFEIEMGMILSMEESQLLVVPVMVKQCPVLDSIKTLTYIDATPGTDLWQRFIGAIVSRDDLLTNYTGTRDVTVRPRHGNMEKLTEIASNYKCPSGEVIRAPYVPEALLSPGIQRKRRIRKALSEANTIFLKYNILVGFNIQMSGCVTSRTFLQFWFYNPAECKDSLARFLEGKHRGMSTHVSQVYASQLINRHSVSYTSAYQEGYLKVKHGVRHVRNAACLCQYIEEKYCGGRIPPLDVV